MFAPQVTLNPREGVVTTRAPWGHELMAGIGPCVSSGASSRRAGLPDGVAQRLALYVCRDDLGSLPTIGIRVPSNRCQIETAPPGRNASISLLPTGRDSVLTDQLRATDLLHAQLFGDGLAVAPGVGISKRH